MIEHGRVVFSGSVEEFDNYIEPNTLYAVFDLPPLPDELLMIAGIKKVEMVGGHGVRLWYDGERDTIKQVIREKYGSGMGDDRDPVREKFDGSCFCKVIRKVNHC